MKIDCPFYDFELARNLRRCSPASHKGEDFDFALVELHWCGKADYPCAGGVTIGWFDRLWQRDGPVWRRHTATKLKRSMNQDKGLWGRVN